MSTDRAYMADYMRRRYRGRRAAAVASLGGRCVECGTTEDLQLDHIDPSTKSFAINSNWSAPEARIWAEVAKCQLLCRPHHQEKTARERSVEHGGGLTGKRNCRCDLCRPRKNAYNRELRARAAADREQAAS